MGVSDVKPLARGLRAKGSAVAFANSENAKWPVAEVSLSHAFTRVIRLRLPVARWEFAIRHTYRIEMHGQ